MQDYECFNYIFGTANSNNFVRLYSAVLDARLSGMVR